MGPTSAIAGESRRRWDAPLGSEAVYDLQTAAQAGVDSTASGRRGVNLPPSPGTSVIIVGEGDAAYLDMVKDITSGLVVERLLEVWPESHWLGLALRQPDVLQSYMTY